MSNAELKALRRANELNLRAGIDNTGETYWTVIVLYHWVVYKRDAHGVTTMSDVIEPADKDDL